MNSERVSYSHADDHDHDDHNHDHSGHHHHAPSSKGKLLAVIFFNSVITIAQFMGGILSGSLALVSDAWHNLSDVLALMLGYAGERVSDMPGGKQFTFGLEAF